ncbi:MAG: purine-nucleoside phosphorylase [Clostridiales bacterium]|nr:purine-nucleoside phosphorylase [Clostridiales bacterium]
MKFRDIIQSHEMYGTKAEDIIKRNGYGDILEDVVTAPWWSNTIFAQYPHIDHFLELGCETIEMESSALFRCGNLTNIKTSAIFCISDNTIKNKSLFSGRTDEERKARRHIRDHVIPRIIIELFHNNIH